MSVWGVGACKFFFARFISSVAGGSALCGSLPLIGGVVAAGVVGKFLWDVFTVKPPPISESADSNNVVSEQEVVEKSFSATESLSPLPASSGQPTAENHTTIALDENAKLHYNHCLNYSKQGDCEKAIVEYNAAAQLDPKITEVVKSEGIHNEFVQAVLAVLSEVGNFFDREKAILQAMLTKNATSEEARLPRDLIAPTTIEYLQIAWKAGCAATKGQFYKPLTYLKKLGLLGGGRGRGAGYWLTLAGILIAGFLIEEMQKEVILNVRTIAP